MSDSNDTKETTTGQLFQLMQFWMALMHKLVKTTDTTQNLLNRLDGFRTLALVLTANVVPIGPENGIEVRYTQQRRQYTHGTNPTIRNLEVHERVWLGYLNPTWINQDDGKHETRHRTLGNLRYALELAGMRCANYHHLVGLAPHITRPCLPSYQGFDDVLLTPDAKHYHPALRMNVVNDNTLRWVECCNQDNNYMNHHVGVLVVMKTEILSPLAHND